MARVSFAVQNFGGELSPRLRGRSDLELYYGRVDHMKNYIADTQGQARFRPGTLHISATPNMNQANLIAFEFSTIQTYILEFTNQKMRVYTDDGIVLESTNNITGITKASPGVVTSSSHGYTNGDIVYISGVTGMTEVNGKYYIVAGATTNTFNLTDEFGSNVDTSGYTTYSSSGTAARTYTLTTPYATADLFNLSFSQTADTMYICCDGYQPRKLTRTSSTSWTLTAVDFIDGPYLPQNSTSVTLSPSGTGTAITFTASTSLFASTDVERLIRWNDGTTWHWYRINAYNSATSVDADRISTATPSGTTATTVWRLGIFSETTGWPQVVTFHENRLFYGNTTDYPQTLWGSMAAEEEDDYDTFTPGTEADDPVTYRIGSRKVNAIRWMTSTDKFLAIGTVGGEFKATGGSDEQPITPTSISIRPVSFWGVARQQPIVLDSHIMYVQRDKRTVRSFEFDALADGYVSIDRTLLAEHITQGNVKQMAYQSGNPNLIWCAKENGEMAVLTFESREKVNSWTRHIFSGEIESVASLPQASGPNRVWFSMKKTINGNTVRHIMHMAEPGDIPQQIDYYTGAANKETDRAAWRLAMFEAQKLDFHVDDGLTYDGSAQSMTMTPGTGADTLGTTDVEFTAGSSLFSSSDVGRQIWAKGAVGRAIITAYTSSTVVECTILVAFGSTSSIAAGSWFLTTDEIQGLEYLEGESVSVCADGGVVEGLTVSGGTISLPAQASTVHIGLAYEGLLITNDLEAGGNNGPAQGKPRSISKLAVRFLETLGCEYGTDIYNMNTVQFRSTADPMNRPPPLFSGIRDDLGVSDSWTGENNEKRVYIRQVKPLRNIVQYIHIHMQTNDT